MSDSPVARRSDPETSHQAAERASSGASTNRALALEALRKAGRAGLTDFELASLTGIAQTSIGVRRGELVRQGLVAATPMRRPSPSGSPAIVWAYSVLPVAPPAPPAPWRPAGLPTPKKPQLDLFGGKRGA